MAGSNISKVGANVEVDKLYIERTNIKELPEDLKVNYLYVNKRQYELFEENLHQGVKHLKLM